MSLVIRSLLPAPVCAGLLLCVSSAPADGIRTWAFEATVVSLDDPQRLFGDVRLGDTIRGDFAYDAAMAPTYSEEGFAAYEHPTGFQGIRVTVENPRTGGELRYALGPDTWLYAESATDESFYEESSLLLWQSAEAPLPGLWPIPFINFSGDDILDNTSLPTELNLDDWSIAAVILAADSIYNGVTAQIYSLTPVLPGDYDHNGAIDVDDYAMWQGEYGSTSFSPADGNRDGVVNAADYALWRNVLESAPSVGHNLSAQNELPTSTTESLRAALPEPGGMALIICWGLVTVLRRRHGARQCWRLLDAERRPGRAQAGRPF